MVILFRQLNRVLSAGLAGAALLLGGAVQAASLLPDEAACALACLEFSLSVGDAVVADGPDTLLQYRFETEQEYLGDIEGPAVSRDAADTASDLLDQPDR